MQHVVITGGSSGIGEAFARLHLARGDRVSLIARDAERLAACKERLAASGRTLSAHSADVRDAAALEIAIAAAEAEFGPAMRLITSAGVAVPGYFEALDADSFREQMDINFHGTVHAVRAVYRGMTQRRSGEILLVSSAAAFVGLFGYTAYGASKFAVAGFAESLRAEARRHGIKVAVCFPPDTETPQLEAENRLKPPETASITKSGGIMTADQLATSVVRDFERGKFAIYPGLRVSLLGRFSSLARPAINLWLDRTAERADR
jgi:3-dehydrosphinganine reductase